MYRAIALLPVSLVAVLFVCLNGNCGAETEEQLEQEFRVNAPPNVTIRGFNGAITIEEGSEGLVRVVCTKFAHAVAHRKSKSLDDIEVRMHQKGDNIEIEARSTSHHIWSGGGVRFDIEVPPGSDVVAITTNGAIRLDNLNGNARLETTNGPITIEDARGKIYAETSNGTIKAEMESGSLEARSTNGSILVDGEPEALDLKASNGRIGIDIGDTPCTVKARTSNGRITYEGALVGRNEFVSSNGMVTLELPNDSMFGVNALTTNGKIINDFAMSEYSRNDRKCLIATSRSGSDEKTSIRIRTTNSSIKILED